MRKLILLNISCLFSLFSYAQIAASASSFATIISPITISKSTDLNFGNISIQSTATGSLSLTLAPNGSRIITQGITLPVQAGTVSAATFSIGGEGNFTYAINLPTSITLTHSNGSQTITASSFTSNPINTGQLSNGIQTVSVGATLTISSGQLPGVYTSGTFDVTVAYN